jgi:hypothetical protein
MIIKNRKEENVIQGTEEWLKIRELADITASEAPAVFNESKYQKRNELIEAKKGFKKEFSMFALQLFKKGHEAEASAREILEEEELESFPAKVFTCEVDGLKLLASLDGISEDGKTIYEHKLDNKELLYNTKVGLIDEAYSIQLDEQLLVSGAEKVIFIVSNGTSEIKESLIYKADPEKFEELIAGIKQFQIDKENHVFELKKEKIVVDSEAFPIVKYSVEGSLISTNFSDVKESLELISKDTFELLEKEDKTDLDFGKIENVIKAAKSGRKSLKEINGKVVGGFESFEEFLKNVKEVDLILQKMSSAAEKLMKTEKDNLKAKIVNDARQEFCSHISDSSKLLKINHQFHFWADTLNEAGKGKKTIDSYKESVKAELANLKSNVSEKFISFVDFDTYLDSKKEYSFLFNESHLAETYFGKSFLDFKEYIDSKIDDHKKREEQKLEQAKKEEREKIELEQEKIKIVEEEAKRQERINKERLEEKQLEIIELDKYESRVPEIEVTTPMPEVEEPAKFKDSISYEMGILRIFRGGTSYSQRLDVHNQQYAIVESLRNLADMIEESNGS